MGRLLPLTAIQDTRDRSVHSNNRARLNALCDMAEMLLRAQEWINNELEALGEDADNAKDHDDKMWLLGGKAAIRRLKIFIDVEAKQ